MINKKKLEQIINLIKKCNECAMFHFNTFTEENIDIKLDNSPVTKADLEVNKLAVHGLKNIFPDIKIISEEATKSHNFFDNNNLFWLVDPIDGTKEYINSSPNFTVNFALIENRLPIFGIISQPFSGNIWYNFKNKAFEIYYTEIFDDLDDEDFIVFRLDDLKLL